jgi:hypothetical protein
MVRRYVVLAGVVALLALAPPAAASDAQGWDRGPAAQPVVLFHAAGAPARAACRGRSRRACRVRTPARANRARGRDEDPYQRAPAAIALR